MVAIERIKLAETEEELRQARDEKEALKGAMRVIESENGQLRGRAISFIADDQRTIRLEGSENRNSLDGSAGDVGSPPFSDELIASPLSPNRSLSSSSSSEDAPASEPSHLEMDSSTTPLSVFVAEDELESWSQAARAESPSSMVAVKTPPRSPSRSSLEIDELQDPPMGQ